MDITTGNFFRWFWKWSDGGLFGQHLRDSWLSYLTIFDLHSFPVMIPRWRIQDIDTRDDWKRSELLFNMLNKKV